MKNDMEFQRQSWVNLMLKYIGEDHARELTECEIAYAITKSGFFDPRFYLKQYEDVRQAGIDPVLHFIRNGYKENRFPNHIEEERQIRPCCCHTFVDFIRDYIDKMRHENLPLVDKDDLDIASVIDECPQNKAISLLRESGLYDAEAYYNMYPDVINCGMDAFEHYVKYGYVEGRELKRLA